MGRIAVLSFAEDSRHYDPRMHWCVPENQGSCKEKLCNTLFWPCSRLMLSYECEEDQVYDQLLFLFHPSLGEQQFCFSRIQLVIITFHL